MILHNIVQAIFLLTGMLTFFSSILDWEWFFTADNCRFVVKRLGRNGARWFYGVVGVLLIAAAVFFYFQVERVK